MENHNLSIYILKANSSNYYLVFDPLNLFPINLTYNSFKDDPGMKGLCGRPDEIAIRFKTIVSGKQKYQVPACFTCNTGISGHVDFSKFLQPDGSPWGGNIDSQHVSDAGYGALDPNNIHGG